jgi:hypothetical protein
VRLLKAHQLKEPWASEDQQVLLLFYATSGAWSISKWVSEDQHQQLLIQTETGMWWTIKAQVNQFLWTLT